MFAAAWIASALASTEPWPDLTSMSAVGAASAMRTQLVAAQAGAITPGHLRTRNCPRWCSLGFVEQTLTLNPANMTRHRFDASVEPEWAALAAYLRDVAEAGDVVQVRACTEGLSPNQVAGRMGMSRSTVLRMIEAGKLRAYKVGTHWRIPLAEFDRYRLEVDGRMLDAIADDLEADLIGE